MVHAITCYILLCMNEPEPAQEDYKKYVYRKLAAVELRLATLSFSSYDQFIPNTRQMDLAADAFERKMLAAGGITSSLGYSIGEVESKLKEFLMWSEGAARPLL